MSSLPGGPADKLGNRYEHWWTAYRVADLLEGRGTRMRLEPPGAAGLGIEFEIEDVDGVWCEQVKDAPGGGRWTPHRLTKEGVLVAIQSHLAEGKRVRLVLSTDAGEVKALTDRARAACDTEEFMDMLTGPLRADLQKLVVTWGTTDEDAWRQLQRLYVENHPPESLRRLMVATYGRLLNGDPDSAINELRGFLDDNLHQTLAAPQIWSYFEQRGFSRRLLVGDDNTSTALRATVQRHINRINRAVPNFGTVERPDINQLVERLLAADCPQIVVCDGQAGSGKSTVVANVLEHLTSAGWFAAVARMDGLDAATRTAAALGRSMDLSDSPAILLAGVANGSLAVLVIDQLDAVSIYSGRMPDGYDAVVETMEQLAATPNVKILLTARTIDIERDPRLQGLVADTVRVERLQLGTLDIDAVRNALEAAGTDPATVGVATLELLRVPLHLAVFSRLSESARTTSYRSLQELYKQFTMERRIAVESRIHGLDWDSITGRLINYLSNNEVLMAPEGLLDAASPIEVGALESDAILIRDGDRVGFFHETYFDYLFARGFVTEGGDLHDFLAVSGQHLFRRAQTRQVLEYLVSTDRDQFRRTVVRLLTSDTIRLHLQDVVVDVLRQLDANADDWTAIEAIAWSETRVAPKIRNLLSHPRWFDAADRSSRWELWLSEPDNVDALFRQLILIARDRPERVEQLVRPYIGASDLWRFRLQALLEWSMSSVFVDLAVDLIDRGDADEARGPIAVNSDFWSIIHGLPKDDPAGAARVIGAYLQRQLARARAEGSGDPFESGHLNRYSQGGDSTIIEAGKGAASAYVDNVLPFVAEVATASAAEEHDSSMLASGRWGYRYLNDHSVDGAVFTALDFALQQLAKENPPAALTALEQLANTSINELRFLACRIYTVLDRPDEALDWLLSDDRNLLLGWADSARWASRELITATTAACSDDVLQRLTAKLLDYYPEWEQRAGNQPSHGRAQYELLTAVDEARRNDIVRRRIGELERKFAAYPPAPPQAVEAHFVGSPVAETATEHMSDDDWRRAFAKYPAEARGWRNGRPVGGARELAGALGRRAEEEPERFTALALTFTEDIPAAALSAIIEAVATKIDVDKLAKLCKHAQALAGSDVGRSICHAITAVATQVNEILIELLDGYASDPDPDHETARIESPSGGGLFYGGDLLTAGLNTIRGQAALAAAAILFAGDEHVDRLIPTATLLANDPILAVRVCAAELVVALLNHRREVALDLAAKLFAHPDEDVFDSRLSERLLIYSVINENQRFADEVSRALNAAAPVAERAGRVWAVAAMRDLLTDNLPNGVSELADSARRGAAEMFATNITGAVKQLIALFDDADPDVRRTAAGAMRNVAELDTEHANDLIRAFVSSAAFSDHFDQLTFALKHATSALPEATMEACERAVEVSGQDLGDIRTARAATSRDLVSIVLRLYRQGGPALRSRCLDVIDQLADMNAYGLSEALEAER